MSDLIELDDPEVVPRSTLLLNQVLAEFAVARAAAIDAEIVRRIVDPWLCPVRFLPWLAHAYSVDVWSDDWPEATKRRVIAAAPEVHRIKGTRRAVRLALAALGGQTTIREWWQSTPPARRGTFRVRVHADGSGPILDLTLLRQMHEAVRRAKPKSRVFELEVALEARAPILAAITTRTIQRITLLPAIEPVPDPVVPLYVAAVYGLSPPRRTVILPSRPGDTPSPAPVRVAVAYSAAVRRTIILPATYN